jgi:hypothetical protein
MSDLKVLEICNSPVRPKSQHGLLTASEQMYFQGAQVAHVIAYEQMLRERRHRTGQSWSRR